MASNSTKFKQKKMGLFLGAALLLGLVGGYWINQWLGKQGGVAIEEMIRGGGRGGKNKNMLVAGDVSRSNCVADDCLLVEDIEYPVGGLPDEVEMALEEALSDEYMALATYESVIGTFGMVRPFSMIVRAEEQHIASLKALYDKYGLEPSANTGMDVLVIPETLKQVCQLGVEAEMANARLYREELLPAVSEFEDITAVFNNLMNASEQKHLPAFERCN